MSHTDKRTSNVYYLNQSDSSASKAPDDQDSRHAKPASGPDYEQLVDSMQLLRIELRAAEASLGLFHREVEQSINNCLYMDFASENVSGK